MFLHKARAIGANIGWLVGDRLFRMMIGVVVLGLVARHLGEEQFGLLNYAISLTAIFVSVANLGMDGIVIRELVKTPDKVTLIMGTAWCLRFVGGTVALALVAVLGWCSPNGNQLAPLVILIGLAFLPQAFDVIDLFFQKDIQSKYTVMAKMAAMTLGSTVKIGLVWYRAPTPLFALALLADAVFGAAALIWVYQRREGKLMRWRPAVDMARGLLRDSWPLILSGLLVALYVRVEQILVMNRLGSRSMGIYAASTKIADMWGFVPPLILSSLYPLLVAARQKGIGQYRKQMQLVFDVLTSLGFLVAVVVSVSATWLIPMIFGRAYAEAAPILIVQAWTAPIVFSGSVRAQYLLLENLTVYHVWSAILGIAANVSLALWLMPQYGARGAALGALGGYWISAWVTSFIFAPLRDCGHMQSTAFAAPLRWRKVFRSLRTQP
jgi:O-antigen/teichoic acid export membrane protein